MNGMTDSFARAERAYGRMEPPDRHISDEAVIERAEFLMTTGEPHYPFEPQTFLDALDDYFFKHPASAAAMTKSIKDNFTTTASAMRDIAIAYSKGQAMQTAQQQLEEEISGTGVPDN